MDKNEIFKKVQSAVCDVLKVDPNKVTTSTLFREDLNADSIDMATLSFDLEDIFDKEIDIDELKKLLTINDVIELIAKMQNESNVNA